MRVTPRRPLVPAVAGLVAALVAGTGASAASAAEGPTAGAAAAAPTFVLPDLNDAGGILPLSRSGVSALIADFTADGKPDALVPTFGRTGASVLPGDGVGGFAAPKITVLPSGGSVIDAAAGKVNGDTRLDAVVAAIDDVGSSIRVLLGKGDGTFTLGQRISYTGATVTHVVVGDVNGDGRPDLAAAVDQPSGDNVQVALGLADGTFGPRTVYEPPFSLSVSDLDLVDVDGDGDLDLVYLEGCPVVRLNAGDGTFGVEICSTDSGARLSGVAQTLADFNGDGDPDLALGDASGGHLTIGLGDGAGKFVFAAQYGGLGGQVNSITNGDFTGDGKPDIVVSADAQFGTPTRVAALFAGAGDGTFKNRGAYATGGDGLAGADLDGDGVLDLVSGGYDGGHISATHNAGGGRFVAPTVYKTTGTGVGTIVRTADVDNDGGADVIFVTDDGLFSVFRHGKAGALRQPPITSGGAGRVESLAVADVDNDGYVDLIAGSQPSNNVYVMLGKGNGKFGAAKKLSNGSTAAVLGVAVGDVDGDGNADIVSNTFAAISVLPGRGDGTFGAPILSGAGGGFQVATVLGDLTGDGDLDAVSVIRTGNADNAGSSVTLNEGNGDGTFNAGQQRTVDTNANAAVLVTTDALRPSVALVGLKGTHSGRTGLFVFPPSGGALGSPAYLGGPGSDLTVGDLNGDKAPDIATIGDVIAFFTNNGSGIFAAAGTMAAGQSAFGIAAGDVTAKKSIDLVELDSTNPQQVVVYRNTAR